MIAAVACLLIIMIGRPRLFVPTVADVAPLTFDDAGRPFSCDILMIFTICVAGLFVTVVVVDVVVTGDDVDVDEDVVEPDVLDAAAAAAAAAAWAWA